MSVRTLMWTALPNGLDAAGMHLKLSVLVSPRLVTDGPVGSLAQFPDLIDWPSVVKKLRFHVEFLGGPSVTVAPVTEPGFPAPDSQVWAGLFDQDTPVRSYAFDDRSGLPVRSFPTRRVADFVKGLYGDLAVNSPSARPSLDDLGFGNREDSGFSQLAIHNADDINELDDLLEIALKRSHAVPGDFGSTKLAFYQVRVMHQALSKKVLRTDGELEFLPAQTRPDYDFHQAVAAMAQYPKLERALGLVIDLEVPTTKVPHNSRLRVVPALDGPPPLTPWTAYAFDPARQTFFAAADPAGSDVSDGMLLLAGSNAYDIVTLDVDGAAEKVLDFSTNLARIAFGRTRSTIDTPQNYGPPSLRNAGFSAARVDRALRLVKTFQTALARHAAITSGPNAPPVVLHAEDVTRGYRIDVWTSLDGVWHSLCFRDGTYTFRGGKLQKKFSDEGYVTLATTQSADGTTPDLRLPESLFRWDGWSLCARRPGRTIGSDSKPADVRNPATTAIPLATDFRVTKGTLPRLRFGAFYQFRARAVDLAGNSLPADSVLDDRFNLPAPPVAYLRHEPVPAPIVVLRAPLGPDTTPGESVERVVIRSDFNTHIAAVSERHIVPPKASIESAEQHGMLDTPAGPPDKALYATLVARDGSLPADPAHPEQSIPVPGPEVALPYLPDPLAPGAALRGLPGTTADFVEQVPFSGTWPDVRPFRLVLDEGAGPPTFTESATERVLTVHLPKADVATVPLSCYLSDEDTTRPPHLFQQMAVAGWITEANPPNLADLKALILSGGHWMVTPPRVLTLVHAVLKPLIEPEFQALRVARLPGDTRATLTDQFPISGKSTIRVDIEGHWFEPVDDLGNGPQPTIREGHGHAATLEPLPSDIVAELDQFHEFHDTKHRRVEYTAKATTRFREYFPASVTADEANLTRRSQPLTLSVPSSSRPPAPRPLWVIPTFGWDESPEGAWDFRKRGGGGLRVYLDRPWFASGEGERLGAVLWSCAPGSNRDGSETTVPERLRTLVTQWGLDPLHAGLALPVGSLPRREQFLNATAARDGLTLDELPAIGRAAPITVAVVGHDVFFDTNRKLWYADIVMDPGDSYFPFVRLALVRFQPESIANAHLSRVVLADYMQLLPDRSASVTFDPIEATSLTLAVTGQTFSPPGSALVAVTVQTQPLGGPTGDAAAWVSVQTLNLQAFHDAGARTLWTTPITLPAPRGTRPFRLLIEEFETYPTDVQGFHSQRRLVYADVIEL